MTAAGAPIEFKAVTRRYGSVTADNREGILKPGMPIEADLAGGPR